MNIFKPWNFGETFMLPPDPRDWLSTDHEAFYIAELILKLAKDNPLQYRDPEAGGRPAYHPVMMLTVMVFAYLRGVRSSRKIARLLEENIAFKVLSGDQCPDFRTLARFRALNATWFEKMLTRTLHVGMIMRVIDWSAVVVDGTPIQASANQGKSLTLKGLKKLKEAELEALALDRAKAMMADAQRLDGEEDLAFGDDLGRRSMLKLKGLTSERLERLDEAIAKASVLERARLRKELKARAVIIRLAKPARKQRRRVKGSKRRKIGAEGKRKLLSRLSSLRVPKKPKVNYTDPDSLTMKAKNGGFVQGYQVVRATDLHSGMIMVNHLSPTGGESRELPKVVEKVLKATGIKQIFRLMADKGFGGEPNLLAVKKAQVFDLLIMQKATAKNARVRAQLRLNQRRKYWLRQRGVAEGSNAGTKEARGFRRFYLRRWGGAAIELALDAIAHNIMKLKSKIKALTDDKLQQALINSALCEG